LQFGAVVWLLAYQVVLRSGSVLVQWW
jgi:hypothetical protein